jgi:methyl coenzyme M reductase subunit C
MAAIGRRGARGGAHYTSSGELSHRGMFLNLASVRRHIAATKPCCEANMGIREIRLEARAGDVMAGGGGALRGLRLTSDISLQVTCRQKSKTIY